MREFTVAALEGAKLVPVTDAEMAKRYRECMVRLGLEPTKLRKFSVDGRGWSFEISDEMDNPDYLAHGGAANPLGIVISIDQEFAPICAPTHSFDQVMMREYFRTNRSTIADITTQTGIALDIDQRMTWYRTLDNIAAVRAVHIISDAGRLAVHANNQVNLVRRFKDTSTNEWMDDNLRQQLIESLKDHGQLYRRKLLLREHMFTQFDDFYTTALGGVYVFRHKGVLALVIAVDPKQKQNASVPLQKQVASLTDADIVERIYNAGIAGVEASWYQQRPNILAERVDRLERFILADSDPEMPIDTMSQVQVKGRLQKCNHPHVADCIELEEMAARLQEGEEVDGMSSAVRAYLLHPIAVYSQYEEDLVWRLIGQVQRWPVDIRRLYSADAKLFIDAYSKWSKPLRKWARNEISNDS